MGEMVGNVTFVSNLYPVGKEYLVEDMNYCQHIEDPKRLFEMKSNFRFKYFNFTKLQGIIFSRESGINCKKNKEINDLKEAEKLLNNNELLLIMTGSTCISAYMKFENNTTKVRVHTHIGTFQDSVLISNNKVDFRYFPEDDCLEIYHWSDGLNNVLIKNIGKTDIKVLDTKVIICKADKITKINGNQPHNEELISPDFVNGKNILTKK